MEPLAACREHLEGLFEARGWSVVRAKGLPAGGAESAVDLVVIPPSGAGADIKTVVEEVRACPELAVVPVILLADGENCGEALADGVTEVFSAVDLEAFGVYLDTLSSDDGLSHVTGQALVVDDNPVVAAYISEVIRRMGVKVVLAASANAAKEALRNLRFDLLVLDVVLGEGESGLQVLRHLRRSAGTARDIPVIMVSAYEDAARRLDALRAGANCFMQKPFSEPELVYFVGHLLGRPAAHEVGAEVPEISSRSCLLSEREVDICRLVAAGLPDKRVAERLGISYWTVRSHMASIFRKCGVMNRIELANLFRAGEADGGNACFAGRKVRQGVPVVPEQLLDAMPWAVLATDGQGTIVYVNDEFTRLTGYSPGEAVGQTPRILVSGSHDAGFYKAMRQSLALHGTWCGDVMDRAKDGSVFQAQLDIRRIGAGGKGVAFVAVLRPLNGIGRGFPGAD